MLCVEIISAGEVDAFIVEHVSTELVQQLGFGVTRIGSAQVPARAYNSQRNQYNSTKMLELLSKRESREAMLLILTSVDLYVEGLNFVFGEANLAGKSCIVSIARLGACMDSKRSTDLLKARVIKEAIHEIGHVLGLRHCQDSRCVMFFSNSIVDTDRKSEKFCKRCMALLESVEIRPRQ